jgi:predicted nucleic acid-binding Zn ribbon protein
MKKIGGFKRAIESVENTLQAGSLMHGLRPHMAKIWWAEVAGPQVAAVTQAERIEMGPDRCVLVIRAKNSVWANELTLLKGKFLDGLNQRLGGKVLTDLRFKASGLAKLPEAQKGFHAEKRTLEEAERQRKKRDAFALHESERARIETAVSEITDAKLRDKVYNSLVKAAQTSMWRRNQGWVPCTRCGSLTPPGADASSVVCAVCKVLAPGR